MDDRQHCTYLNPAAERLTGYRLDEVQGRPLHDVIHHTRPDGRPYPLAECPIDRAFPQNNRVEGEEVFVHRDGFFYPVAYTASPVREGGRIVGTVIEVRDIRAEKAAQQARDELHRQIEANRRREDAHAARQRQLAEAALAINRSLSLDEALRLITDVARRIIGAHQALTSFTADREWAQSITAVSLSEKYPPWRAEATPPDGSGIYRLVCEQNRVMRLTERALEAHPAYRRLGAVAGYPPLRGWLAAPLIGADGRNIGLIQLSEKVDGEFTEEDEAIAVQLAQMASVAVENARLFAAEQAARHAAEEAVRRTSLLQAITADLSKATTGQEAAGVIIHHSMQALDASAGSVFGLSEDRTDLELLADVGTPPVPPEWSRCALDAPVPIAETVRTREPLFFESRAACLARYPVLAGVERVGPGAIVAVPLAIDGRSVGALGLAFREDRAFAPEDRAFLLTLAQQCAQALDRARLYDAAQAAIRARDEFLSIASHELRTPVASIKGFAQLLLRSLARGEVDPQRLTRLGQTVVREGDRLAALVQDLLDVSRIQSGRLELRPRRIDLASALREVLDRLREHLLPGQTLDADLPAEGPLVEVDPDRMDQVFANLVDNAVKYSPYGGRIVVALYHDPSGLLVTVRDQGIGLPPGCSEQVFEPFGRAPNAASGHLPGMGLGLYICRKIVEQHGGRMWLDSLGEGRGTTVSVWLPPTVLVHKEGPA